MTKRKKTCESCGRSCGCRPQGDRETQEVTSKPQPSPGTADGNRRFG